MKPLHIGLLIAAGALGGGVLMRVVQRPQSGAPPMVAQAPADPVQIPDAAVKVPDPVQAPVAAPAEVHPSPFVPPRETTKRSRTYTKTVARAGEVRSAGKVETPVPQTQAPAPTPDPIEERKPEARATEIPPARPEPEHVTPPPPAPPEPHRVTLNAGTLIPVRLVDGLTSERNMPGDLFTATLDKELVVDGYVIAERGARVEGRVVASDRGGRVKGVASLAVVITRLHLSDGQTVVLATDSFERQAAESRRDDAVKVGAGAALGAVIGAIAGGGKGAAIGAGAGGAAGAGTVMATRGRAAALPSETRISFRLREAVAITEKVRG